MTKTILLKSALVICVPASISGIVPLTIQSSLPRVSNDLRSIPEDYLNIEEKDGRFILHGFKSGITPDDIRENNYNAITIPWRVTDIAPYAFAFIFDGKSTPISTLTFEKSEDGKSHLTTIGAGAFTNCFGLKNAVNFKDTMLTRIEQDAFNFCQDMFYQDEEGGSVLTFPETLEYIGPSAFKRCEYIKGLVLPKSLVTIDDYAFEGCYHIESIDLTKYVDGSGNQSLPDWVGKISWAFSHVGDYAQNPVVKLNDFLISQETWRDILTANLNLNEIFDISIGEKEMNDETTLKLSEDGTVLKGFKDITLSNYSALRVPDSVTKIEAGAFEDKITSSKLTLILNDNLVEIGANAFKGCKGLTGPINLPSSLTKIDNDAFNGASISGRLVIPNNPALVFIGERAFNKTKITELVLPIQLSELEKPFGFNAFSNCEYLTVIDCHSFDSTTTPPWNWGEDPKENKPFYGIGNCGTIIYPFNATQDTPVKQIGEKFETLGLCESALSLNEWSAALYKEGTPKAFPYHPENPMQGVAYSVIGTEMVGLSDDFSDDATKTSYKIIDIPSNITKIRIGAFTNTFVDTTEIENKEIKPHFDQSWQLTFKPGIVEIEQLAFSDCSGIHGNVVFPSTLKAIGNYAFASCNAINSYTIPSSVETIGGYAFVQNPTGSYPYPMIKYIDISQLPKIPVGWGSFSFSGLPDNGVIYVAKDKTGLVDTLKSQCNLPSGWTAKEI